MSARSDVKLRVSHGVLLTLDMESLDDMRRVVEYTTRIEGIVGYKVRLTAALRLGLPGAVRHLRAVTDLPLIYDHQKAGPDVPDMAAKFAHTCKEAGVDGLILFPIAGPRAVTEFAGNAYRQRLCPIVGGDLPFPDYNAAGGGYVIDDALDKIFRKAISKSESITSSFPAIRPTRCATTLAGSLTSWKVRRCSCLESGRSVAASPIASPPRRAAESTP